VLERLPLPAQVPQDARPEVLGLERDPMALLESSLSVGELVGRREEALRLGERRRAGARVHLERDVVGAWCRGRGREEGIAVGAGSEGFLQGGKGSVRSGRASRAREGTSRRTISPLCRASVAR